MASETDLSDALAKVAAGDKAALRSIYVRQSARMFGLALTILRDRVAAVDAVQDGFVRIWHAARQFEPRGVAAEHWIAGHIRHAALDIARQRGRELPSAEASPDDGIIDPEMLDGLMASEAGARLREVLLGIEPAARQSIVLAYVNGLSCGELAVEVDLPVDRVRPRMQRALTSIAVAIP